VTYSIVARDPDTGELGVAVETCNFAVGAGVPWALPGIGAVATQSFTDESYGALGLDLLAAGKSPEDTIAALVAGDRHEAHRQVGVVDASGRAAVHTGRYCIREAGHAVGHGVVVQANMMRSPEAWTAMLERFESAPGTLAQRLLEALEEAERTGGDFRGRQSAALMVVRGPRGTPPWRARVADLRVDDHPDPLAELRRLLELHEAMTRLRQASSESVESVDLEIERARSAGVREEQLAWAGAWAAACAGDFDEAQRRLAPFAEVEERWADAVASFEAALAQDGE
jgi:uncharacterized Ntn-hydrolase superfamily protein